jgi:hypothetical protein
LLFAAVGALVNGCGVAGIDFSIVVSRFIFPTLIWSACAGGKAALAEGYSTLDSPGSPGCPPGLAGSLAGREGGA